jgi:putative membrane protein
VLADRGIYEKIDQETLNRLAAGISTGIKQGSTCKNLCSAIDEIGGILGKHFPVTHDDTNELPDSIITE